ncbi:MAG: hypothetical protein GX130_04295 [Candidatus Hydrogenedens sp.]|nr:hypothetical protein [Candidatus Hydrogenedens sp.]
MTINIYIDESGSFEKKDGRSIVGGFATTLTSSQLASYLELKIKKFNTCHKTNFFREDIHVSAMLYPKKNGIQPTRSYVSSVPQETKQAFATTLQQALEEIADFYFVSINQGFSFGEISAQAAYGANLFALVGMASSVLSAHCPKDQVKWFVSPRAKVCLPKTAKKKNYHNSFCDYLKQEKNLDVQIIWNYCSGHYFSDVACHYLRKQVVFEDGIFFPIKKIYVTTPDRGVLNSSHDLLSTLRCHMLEEVELSYLFRQSETTEQRNEVLQYIKEMDPDRIESRLLADFLNIIDHNIRTRTVKSDAFQQAAELLGAVLPLAIKKLELAVPDQQKQLAALVQSLYEQQLMMLNHQGLIDHQQNIVSDYEKLQALYGHLLGSPVVNREQTLDFRNRAYNDEMNDFQFHHVRDDFQDTVDERIKEIGNEKDELTGKMCGTIGQAFAFDARLYSGYAASAEKYLQQSLNYFDPGQENHNKSVNYLTTLYWQSMEYDRAITVFFKHPYLSSRPTQPGQSNCDKIESWIHYILKERAREGTGAFEVLNLLRLLGEDESYRDPSRIGVLERLYKPLSIFVHPHQLILKWLGILYINAGAIKKALLCFQSSEKIAFASALTVQATGIPSVALCSIALKRLNKEEESNDEIKKLVDRIELIREQSPGFAEYLQFIGDIETLKKDIYDQDIEAIARWMPYSYA